MIWDLASLVAGLLHVTTWLDLNCHGVVQRPAPPSLATLTDVIVTSSGHATAILCDIISMWRLNRI